MFITIHSTIKASKSKVYEFWTTPSHVCNWNFASPDWHCPSCTIDLKEGGKISAIMSSKDGSMSFDFWSNYDVIVPNEKLALTMGDGRKWNIYFEETEEGTKVTEEFEPESQNPIDMQEMGWQSILNNFKSYVESKRYEKISFVVEIDAPKDQVYKMMLSKETYNDWTKVFTETSHYEGEWIKGNKIRFLAYDKEGKLNGMVSKLDEVIPNEFVSIQHLGEIVNNEDITSGELIDQWSGSHENYHFETIENNGTKLTIAVDSIPEYFSFFNEQYPVALQKLKEICEK
jgi:uncharacterized protein YndB with AHSA1/START domain